MRVVGVRTAKDSLSGCLKDAQGEDVLIVRHGKPLALVIGVEGLDLEDIYWGTNEELLQTVVRRRRQSKTVSHEEARRLLGLHEPAQAHRKRRQASKK
jgi:prevent-host-death family protein